MHQGKLVFAQLMLYLPPSIFRRCVADHNGEHKVNVMDSLVLEPGAFYLMDRGYLDFSQLFVIHEPQAFFVTRAQSNTKFKRRYSHPVDRINTAVLCDQTGVLTTHYSSKDYPATLRRVVVKDDTGKRLVFLTNNFALKPELIADLYRQRWQVDHRARQWFSRAGDAASERAGLRLCNQQREGQHRAMKNGFHLLQPMPASAWQWSVADRIDVTVDH